MNAVLNAFFLFMLFFIMIIYCMTWDVLDPLVNSIYNQLSAMIPSELLDNSFLQYGALKSMLIGAFYVLLSEAIFLSMMSSMINTQEPLEWLIQGIATLIITPILIYILTILWNEMVIQMATVPYFTLTNLQTAFVTGWPVILTANLVFGILGFFFVRRGAIIQNPGYANPGAGII